MPRLQRPGKLAKHSLGLRPDGSRRNHLNIMPNMCLRARLILPATSRAITHRVEIRGRNESGKAVEMFVAVLEN